jgi:pimeloyl-ACP methyl ester carboxylesterase
MISGRLFRSLRSSGAAPTWGQSPIFDDLEGVEKYMREVYAPFGDLSDENWHHLARYGARTMPYNKLSLAWDPAIAQPFLAADQDVDLWSAYDRIRCPVLLLHGLLSDVLPTPIAQEMSQRGPRAELVEFPKIGHAPALMDPTQIATLHSFCARDRRFSANAAAEQYVHPAIGADAFFCGSLKRCVCVT